MFSCDYEIRNISSSEYDEAYTSYESYVCRHQDLNHILKDGIPVLNVGFLS